MITLNRYDEFEVSPCVLLDENNDPQSIDDCPEASDWCLADCDTRDQKIVCWSVFGRRPAGSREAVADFLDRDVAENVAMVLRQGLDLTKQKT